MYVFFFVARSTFLALGEDVSPFSLVLVCGGVDFAFLSAVFGWWGGVVHECACWNETARCKRFAVQSIHLRRT